MKEAPMGLKPELVKNEENAEPVAEAVSVPKPAALTLDRFKSKRTNTIAGVGTLRTALPILKISGAIDFSRLHPDEANYWSDEICFVNVPIKGLKDTTLHLIDEDLAMQYLSNKRIQRFRLALATKPHDVFYLCQIPTQNLDNPWNVSTLQACELAKAQWVQVTSRKEEGEEGYKVDFARDQDAFPEPQWPSVSLDELILKAFPGRFITDERDPAFLRLIGAKL
jgi:hypothetical protein